MNKPLFGEEARTALLHGAEKVYQAVSCTLGARGRNVVMQRWGQPKITNDGVSVAKGIDLEDPFEKQGADLLKEAADKTNKEAGDGTTTAVVLAYSLFEMGLGFISKVNPMVLRRQIEKEGERVAEELKKRAIAIESDADLENIATISVESPENGKIVADAIKTVGRDGLVVVEMDSIPGIRKEEVTGYQFDHGWTNPYMVTNVEKMEAVLDDPFILVADKSWNLIGDLMPVLNEMKEKGHDKLLIIAEEISGELLKFIVLNRIKLRFHAVVVKRPFNKDMLEDIAALTGATAIMQDKGITLVKMNHLGKAKRVVVTENTTTIIDGAGDSKEKVDALKAQIDEAEKNKEEYDLEKLRERYAKLTGKTVILKVGASTEAEAKYLKDKIDDGVSATRAALEEGVVAGGGMTLARIAHDLYKGERTAVEHLMHSVLTAPVDKILFNMGIDSDTERANLIKHLVSTSETSGFDALTGEVTEDLVKQGIIDPVKVTRCALKNAISLAPMLLTTDCVIAELPEKETA